MAGVQGTPFLQELVPGQASMCGKRLARPHDGADPAVRIVQNGVQYMACDHIG